MDRIEELLEKAKELHQSGDINGALSNTYEAVGQLLEEFRGKRRAPTIPQPTPERRFP